MCLHSISAIDHALLEMELCETRSKDKPKE